MVSNGNGHQPGYPNLNRWQPGQSGNPAGKPKGTRSLSTILREALDKEVPKVGVNMTYGEAIIRKLMGGALHGDMRAIKLIFERMEGVKIEMTHDGGVEVKFTGKVPRSMTVSNDAD